MRDDFPKSGYTSRGVLIAAQALAERGDLAGAAQQLNWIIQNSPDQALVELSRLRLAGVLLEQSDYDAALRQLDNPPPAFVALYADRRGDILLAQGKQQEAAEQWERVLSELGNDPLGQIIQLKLDALSGA